MSWFGSFPICTWVFLLLLLAGHGRIIECVQQETVLGLGHSRVRNVLLGGKKNPHHPLFLSLGVEVKGSWSRVWSWVKPRAAHQARSWEGFLPAGYRKAASCGSDGRLSRLPSGIFVDDDRASVSPPLVHALVSLKCIRTRA